MVEALPEYATRQAEKRPDATAVVWNGSRLTYGQLEAASNRLARMLTSGGCRRGDRVALLMPKSLDAITAILGIYKAGCIYVPVDPSAPAPRAAKILETCEPRWILAGGPVAPLLDEVLSDDRLRAAISVGWMAPTRAEGARVGAEFSLADLEGYSAAPLDHASRRDDAAHILFTSGSTGIPKGVVITHGSVAHFVEWANDYFGVAAGDRLSGHPPLHFDLSIYDIFGAFAAGAELYLVPPQSSLLPTELAAFIRTAELTQWFSVPSALAYMARFDVLEPNDFPALRRVLWCGEVLSTTALRYWMERLPHVTFTNLYGPTETTIASSYYTVPVRPDDERAAIPIGTACDGEELLVLGEDLQPVPPGEVGHLYIAGVGLSPGYWRDPERTGAAFLARPDGRGPSNRIYRTGDLAKIGTDGLVYFLGRTDSQVKSRGYRIELGDIESALAGMAGLRDAAVVAVDSGGFEGALICCVYVPEPGHDVTPVTLRREMARVLPVYMLPSRWMAVRELPRTANGKLDRQRLREACSARWN